jgi:hypothetical protein
VIRSFGYRLRMTDDGKVAAEKEERRRTRGQLVRKG